MVSVESLSSPGFEKALHLIVHRKQIELDIRELEVSARNPAYLGLLTSVLAEIKRASDLQKSAPFNSYDRKMVRPIVEGWDFVILYGCYRGSCLDWVTEEITKAKIAVAWSINGTV